MALGHADGHTRAHDAMPPLPPTPPSQLELTVMSSTQKNLSSRLSRTKRCVALPLPPLSTRFCVPSIPWA